jgi:two-component system CheB/CheR fusion protein
MSSPAKVVQPEKTSHSDCYGPDSTCDQRIKDMAECFVEFTTILKRVEGKTDHLMSQTEALQAKNEEMQARNDEIQAKVEQILCKNDELSMKLDKVTPEKLKELVNNSIAEAPILLEMRSEVKFLFE